MDSAALVLWLLTAAGGLLMAAIWLAGGGLQQRDEVLESSYVHVADATQLPVLPPEPRRSRFAAWNVTTHAALAALGLLLLVFYINDEGEKGTGVGAVPWLVVAILVLVSGLGFLMVRRWFLDRVRLEADDAPRRDRPPEQRIPAALVGLHGLLAVATLALVVLVALGMGV
jgi:hypothetical protein